MPVDLVAVREAVLRWASDRSRSVAVRERRDPYAVLVAEYMAHQTQIERVADAWRAFLATFPTLEALARARPSDVLRAWGNLGYNRRALALQRAARAIVAEHGGAVPADPATLERLPGVGPYTARAVAAIAHGRSVGPVDTNVRRVLGRLLAPEGRVPAPSIQVLADALAAGTSDPGAWAYALMDLGATVCRRQPRCEACPLARSCAHGTSRRAATGGRRRRGDGEAGSGSRPSPERVPFPATRRWLRGRILERLRAATGDDWVAIEPPIGGHGPAAVQAALATLEREGLLERHPTDPTRARLPLV